MVTFMKGFFSVLAAIGNIGRYGVRKYLLLSGLITLVLGSVIFYGGYSLSDDIAIKVVEWYPFTIGIEFVEKASAIIGGILIVALGLLLFKFFIIALCSPILSLVSEKVELVLIGDTRTPRFSIVGMITDFIRGIIIGVSNLIKELFFIGLIMMLGIFFPFGVPVFTVLAFLIQSYYAGYSNIDFFMERRFNPRTSNVVASRNKFGLMGIGSAFLLIIMVPVIGWILGPIMGTIAATEYGVYRNLDPQLEPHL
jgi:CysZ protein